MSSAAGNIKVFPSVAACASPLTTKGFDQTQAIATFSGRLRLTELAEPAAVLCLRWSTHWTVTTVVAVCYNRDKASRPAWPAR